MLLGKALVRKVVEYILRQELSLIVRCYRLAVVIYRMGRVCHKTGDYENAKRFYEAAIDRNLEKTLYYPCYAAYYIGLIYKSEGDKMKANEYFKICRKTDSPIYGESIHQKAKREME